jgi:putative PIN family toxin of toxin-antitoxin system
VIQEVLAGRIALFVSSALLEEFEAVIGRPKHRGELDRAWTNPQKAMFDLKRMSETIDAPSLPAPVCRDPDDDAILALAVAAHAEMIVTGDKDLLVLGSYAGIPILNPAEALKRLAGETP